MSLLCNTPHTNLKIVSYRTQITHPRHNANNEEWNVQSAQACGWAQAAPVSAGCNAGITVAEVRRSVSKISFHAQPPPVSAPAGARQNTVPKAPTFSDSHLRSGPLSHSAAAGPSRSSITISAPSAMVAAPSTRNKICHPRCADAKQRPHVRGYGVPPHPLTCYR